MFASICEEQTQNRIEIHSKIWAILTDVLPFPDLSDGQVALGINKRLLCKACRSPPVAAHEASSGFGNRSLIND